MVDIILGSRDSSKTKTKQTTTTNNLNKQMVASLPPPRCFLLVRMTELGMKEAEDIWMLLPIQGLHAKRT